MCSGPKPGPPSAFATTLHHYFPGLPYHNLAKAYARLTHALPSDTVYRKVTSLSLVNHRHTLDTSTVIRGRTGCLVCH